MKLLIADDDEKVRRILVKGLADEGFVVDACANGVDAIDMLDSGQYDLCLLDVMMPQMDGWEVLANLRRQKSNALVLMLTARDAIEHKVKGFALGADDYLVKPFAFAELVARIRALLRRVASSPREIYQYDDLFVDPRRHIARRSDRLVELSPKEINLLALLMMHQGEVLTRAFIIDRVWDMSYDFDSNVVEVNMRRLRSKIDDPFPRKILHTIRGRGYVLR